MENVVLVIHLILALGIIGLVLIQRSEGGGLGIGGGGGGMGGLATPKGTASILTKTTAFFAFCFFLTSLSLAILAGTHNRSEGILDTYSKGAVVSEEAIEDGAAKVEVPLGSESETSEGITVENEEEAVEVESAVEEKPVQKPTVPIGE